MTVLTLSQKEQIWKQILSRIKTKIGNSDPYLFQSFYEGTSIYSIENEVINILVSSLLSKSYFSKDGYKLLLDVVQETLESNYKLNFITKDEIKNLNVTKEKKEEKKSAFFTHCKLNENLTFDNFVLGECNQEAIQAALLITANPSVSYNPLFIYSKPGLGKTHLLHALGNRFLEKFPEKKVQYISAQDFIDEFVDFVKGKQNSDESLKDYFKKIDLLLVDDIQGLKDKKGTSEMFFTVFNQLVNNGKQIVLTADKQPSELQGLEERLVSRFNMGLSVTIHTPDTDTLLRILEKKIEGNQLNINNFDSEGLMFLATHFSKNVRELEGALNKVIFHNIVMKHLDRIELSTVKEAVASMINSSKNSVLTGEIIIEEVANYYNLTDSQIKSKIRTAQIALARRIAMYLCRELLNISYVKIGNLFGGKDHSTVISACTKVETELKTDVQLINAINDIKKRLKKQ